METILAILAWIVTNKEVIGGAAAATLYIVDVVRKARKAMNEGAEIMAVQKRGLEIMARAIEEMSDAGRPASEVKKAVEVKANADTNARHEILNAKLMAELNTGKDRPLPMGSQADAFLEKAKMLRLLAPWVRNP